MTRGAGSLRKLSSVTQSRTTKIERCASPKYTESKRTGVKNSVVRRNSRKSERDEGEGESELKKGRVTRDGIYDWPLSGDACWLQLEVNVF